MSDFEIPETTRWQDLRNEIRYHLSRLWGIRRAIVAFWQRGIRGWADEDTWSFDHYLARVIAEGLRHLDQVKHGVPNEFCPGWPDRYDHTSAELDVASAAWSAWLQDKANWFEWYWRDEDGMSDGTNWIDPEIPDDEKKRRIDSHMAKLKHFYEVVLPEFGKYFGALWD